MTQCVVLRCRRRIREDRVMCTKHWRMVPKPMQERLACCWPPFGCSSSTQLFEAIEEAARTVDVKEEQRAHR